MKPSMIAKEVITESKLLPIFEACQALINSVTVGLTVARELNIADANIIIDVVQEQLKQDIQRVAIDESIKRAIQNRIKGLYIQYLRRKNASSNLRP